MTDLSELFAQEQTNVIDWHGIKTYGLFEFDEVPSRLWLTFESSIPSPVQGAQLRLKGGKMEVNGTEGSDIVLWADTSPKTVSVFIRRMGRGKVTLKLWNVWRGGHDVTQAWLGNAALQVDGDLATGSFRLLCSDGLGDPQFDDLVLGIKVEGRP